MESINKYIKGGYYSLLYYSFELLKRGNGTKDC